MNRFYSIILIMFFNAVYANAQVDTTIVMSGLVVNGNRTSTPFSEASRNIQIITKKDISKKPVQSIPEILSYTPGVDIRQRGPMGVQSDIGIRGGTFEQTLILLNGIKLTDTQTGHHVMNIPIPLDNIQQIEVLKGPGARIYGRDAFAGAVNFITKIPDDQKIGLRTYAGSFGSLGNNLTFSLPMGKYKQSLSLSRDVSEGYRYNTDYKIDNIYYQSELPVKEGVYELIFGLTDRKFGANGFYISPNHTEQYEEVRTSITSLSYESNINRFYIKPRIYWRTNRDKYMIFRNNPGAYQNLHKTNLIGAEINSSYQSSMGVTGFGIEYRKEIIYGDWLRGGTELKSNIDGFERDDFGLFADHKFKIGRRLDITPGAFLNWSSDFDLKAFPGIDFGYNINNKIRLFGNVGNSYRIPTMYDLYYIDSSHEGNPELMPEEAITYELGFRYLIKGISLEGIYFVRDASQLIDWVQNPEDSVWRSQNLQDVLTSGVELAMNIDFNELIRPDLWLSNIDLSYNYLDQNIDEVEGIQSRYALEHVRNQVILGINHKIAGKLKNSFKARYVDRIEQDSYLLLDDRIFYEHSDKFTAFLEVVNLTDQTYTEVMTQMPGRWIRAGINLNVGF